MKKAILTMSLIASLTVAFGCVESDDNGGLPGQTAGCPNTGANVFVTTSDFTVGTTAVLYGNPVFACLPQTEISSDSAAEVFGSRVYVVNRWGFDNIHVLGSLYGFLTMTQYSVVNGSNPQDIMITNGKAFVSRLQNAKIWVGDPLTGVMSTEIDLSAYADADLVPEAARMVTVNDKLFVALQRLDSTNWFSVTDKSSVAIIDTDTNAVVQVIDLVGKNPVTRLVYDGSGKIYVGTSGTWQSFGNPADSGGVEVINVDTVNDIYTVGAQAVTEATLGGDISHIAIVSATQGYALISDAAFNNTLVRFNPTTGAFNGVLYTTTGYCPDMIVKNGLIYLADRTAAQPGVRIFDTATDAQVGNPIHTGLPPYALAPM